MRLLLAMVAASAFLATVPVERPAFASEGAAIQDTTAPADPAGGTKVDVDVERHGDRPWYLSPLWIGVGVVALLLIVLLSVASRDGGTTIVKT